MIATVEEYRVLGALAWLDKLTVANFAEQTGLSPQSVRGALASLLAGVARGRMSASPDEQDAYVMHQPRVVDWIGAALHHFEAQPGFHDLLYASFTPEQIQAAIPGAYEDLEWSELVVWYRLPQTPDIASRRILLEGAAEFVAESSAVIVQRADPGLAAHLAGLEFLIALATAELDMEQHLSEAWPTAELEALLVKAEEAAHEANRLEAVVEARERFEAAVARWCS